MKVKTLASVLGCSLALSATALGAEPSAAGKSSARPAPAAGEAARAVVARAPQPASRGDMQRYAAREEASPGAKNYEGGDSVIVISASAATIILAVVLLVVLL